MIPYLASAGLVAIALLAHAHRYSFRQMLSPDGQHYRTYGDGGRVPSPYARRWLLPEALGESVTGWRIASTVSTLALGPLIYALTYSLPAVWLFAWLPIVTLTARAPILVDPTALALSLGSVVLLQSGHVALACALVFLAGQTKESAPVFAMLLAGATYDPWFFGTASLSLGVAMAVGQAFAVGRCTDKPAHDFLDPIAMILPWGAISLCCAYAAVEVPWTTVGVLAVTSACIAYAQLFVATDGPRLYQWCAPAVFVWLAPSLTFSPWLCIALAAHPFLCAMTRKP